MDCTSSVFTYLRHTIIGLNVEEQNKVSQELGDRISSIASDLESALAHIDFDTLNRSQHAILNGRLFGANLRNTLQGLRVAARELSNDNRLLTAQEEDLLKVIEKSAGNLARLDHNVSIEAKQQLMEGINVDLQALYKQYNDVGLKKLTLGIIGWIACIVIGVALVMSGVGALGFLAMFVGTVCAGAGLYLCAGEIELQRKVGILLTFLRALDPVLNDNRAAIVQGNPDHSPVDLFPRQSVDDLFPRRSANLSPLPDNLAIPYKLYV